MSTKKNDVSTQVLLGGKATVWWQISTQHATVIKARVTSYLDPLQTEVDSDV